MDIRRITSDFSVTGQIQPREMAEVCALGFRTVICNRPDGEAADQPLFSELAEVAKDCGLTAVYLPVSGQGLQPDDVAELKKIWATLPRPVLAFCRSGARSAAVFDAAIGQN